MALSNKGKKAEKKLKAIKDKTSSKATELSKIKGILEKTILKGQPNDSKKCRSMIDDVPNRIEFEESHLKFYIDFTVTCKESENPSAINGSIIYGVSRTNCFRECPNPDNKKECQRSNRCDHFEDKPLIEFTVTGDELIKSSQGLEDEWLLDDEESLREMHLRTMVHIWKDALDWTNEKILP